MINDVKWVQAQRHASDWRHALDIAVRPLITFGAAAPCYLDGIIENRAILSYRAGDCAAPCQTGARRQP